MMLFRVLNPLLVSSQESRDDIPRVVVFVFLSPWSLLLSSLVFSLKSLKSFKSLFSPARLAFKGNGAFLIMPEEFPDNLSAGKPVAMTVTFISPFFSLSSLMVPNMTLASGSIDSVMMVARFEPPPLSSLVRRRWRTRHPWLLQWKYPATGN